MKEKYEKLLEERKKLRDQLEVQFYQILGQIALLEQLLKEEKTDSQK